jgi:hypothetical protein
MNFELERLHSFDPSNVPKESHFFLDFDIDDLAEDNIYKPEQRILAMRAACTAGMQARGRSRQLYGVWLLFLVQPGL